MYASLFLYPRLVYNGQGSIVNDINSVFGLFFQSIISSPTVLLGSEKVLQSKKACSCKLSSDKEGEVEREREQSIHNIRRL